MRQSLITFVTWLHTRLFGYPPSPKMLGFLRHLSWSFVGVIGSALILFVVGILAGRILGPVEYGKYSLCITLANIISVLGDLGFDQASLKFTSGSEAEEGKEGKFFSVSFRITFTLSLVVSLILIFAAGPLSSLTGLDKVILIAAGPYAFMSATRQSLEAFVRARDLFKAQALIKLLEATVTAILFAIVVLHLGDTGFGYYVGILAAAGIVTMLIYGLRYARPYFGSWDTKVFVSMRSYALSSAYISMLGLIALNVDRFFLNHSLGSGQVGIYSAYLLAPSMLAAYFTAAVINVFFPTISRLADKKGILKQVDRLSLVCALPALAFYFLAGWITLRLLGNQYGLNYLYLSLAAVYGLLLIYVALVATVIGSSQQMFLSYARYLIVKLVFVLAIYVTLSITGLISIPALIGVLICGVSVDIVLLRRSLGLEYGNLEISPTNQ